MAIGSGYLNDISPCIDLLSQVYSKKKHRNVLPGHYEAKEWQLILAKITTSCAIPIPGRKFASNKIL